MPSLMEHGTQLSEHRFKCSGATYDNNKNWKICQNILELTRTLQLNLSSLWLRLREVIASWSSQRSNWSRSLELNSDLHPSIQHCFHSSYSPSLCPRMWWGLIEIMQLLTPQTCWILLVFRWELKNIDSSNKPCLYFYSLMEGLHVNSNHSLFQRILNIKKI